MITPNKYPYRKMLLVTFIIIILLMGSFMPAQAATQPVRVPADVEWVYTGIEVQQGDVIHIQTEGVALTARINIYGPGSISGPDGQWWGLGCGQYEGAEGPCALDDFPYGMLVGKIGADGLAFPVGRDTSFTANASGFLYLSVNDNLGFYADNEGGYTVLFR